MLPTIAQAARIDASAAARPSDSHPRASFKRRVRCALISRGKRGDHSRL
jgi:hypothetical protein